MISLLIHKFLRISPFCKSTCLRASALLDPRAIKILSALLLLLACMGHSNLLPAQEKGTIAPLISISKEAKGRLKAGETIALFLNGNDPLLTRIIDDALTIHLTNAGFVVPNREVLEKSVGEQLARKRKEKAEGAINALEIGKIANADSVLIGTVIIGSGEQQSLFVKVASFQLVDVERGRTLLALLFEFEKGKSFSEVASTFVEILRQSMR